ncbi:MAG: RpiB/LacA/LacB family sugar-phosphate isomerase [Rikenellaceae bacterium]
MKEKIGIACDHAGYDMKELLVGFLDAKGFDVIDYGCYSEESIDYPDFGHALAQGLEQGEVNRIIGLCGSGEGMTMTLNKHQKVRAGLVWCNKVAQLIREHNDANAIVLPARFISNDEAVEFVSIWLTTPFEGGRHASRIEKIAIK